MRNNLTYILITMLPVTVVEAQKQTIAVMNIESHEFQFNLVTITNMVRFEVEKTGLYDVIDPYDATEALRKAQMSTDTCHGRECLALAGRTIGVERVLTGSIVRLPARIVISLRIINSSTAEVEASHMNEFLELPENLQQMIRIAVQSLMCVPVNKELERALSDPYGFESSVNNPQQTKVNLGGPRTGITVITGSLADDYAVEKENGGYDMEPWLWNFGWQFETQFVNAGYAQALFEYVVNVAGFEKGRCIPSASILLGYRNNRHGLEIAVGPITSIVRVGPHYYMQVDSAGMEQKVITGEGLSPKGNPTLFPGLLVVAGKTFKSGAMNIPLNVFVIPRPEGWSFGLSCGFNIKHGG